MSVCCNEIDKLSGLSETHLASRLGELLANDPVRGETLKTIIAATDFSHGLSFKDLFCWQHNTKLDPYLSMSSHSYSKTKRSLSKSNSGIE
jgi:hypothetical protein